VLLCFIVLINAECKPECKPEECNEWTYCHHLEVPAVEVTKQLLLDRTHDLLAQRAHDSLERNCAGHFRAEGRTNRKTLTVHFDGDAGGEYVFVNGRLEHHWTGWVTPWLRLFEENFSYAELHFASSLSFCQVWEFHQVDKFSFFIEVIINRDLHIRLDLLRHVGPKIIMNIAGPSIISGYFLLVVLRAQSESRRGAFSMARRASRFVALKLVLRTLDEVVKSSAQRAQRYLITGQHEAHDREQHGGSHCFVPHRRPWKYQEDDAVRHIGEDGDDQQEDDQSEADDEALEKFHGESFFLRES
jgi:hypothetical protein